MRIIETAENATRPILALLISNADVVACGKSVSGEVDS